MRTIEFVPGAIVTPNPITIPLGAPDIYAVVTAEITRWPTGLGVADHAAADVVAAFADHPPADIIAAFTDHLAADIVAGFDDHAAAAVIAGVIDHPAANIVAALADHAVHAHDLVIAIGAVVEAYGASGAGVADFESFTGQNIPGAGASGVQDIGAAQAHSAAAAVAHAAGAALVHAIGVDVAHVADTDVAHTTGAAVAHGAAGDPVIAAVPTIGTTGRLVTLDVSTLVGDILTLRYLEVGEFARAS